MNDIFNKMFLDDCLEKSDYSEENERILTIEAELREGLSPYEKELLLQIHNDFTMIQGKTEMECFSRGLKMGISVIIEILYK
ncbi:MAG: hypothetical protein Q8876_02255 [Bacillota bacterium]|nr:hypothetical protein [Bacillota bacterium]